MTTGNTSPPPSKELPNEEASSEEVDVTEIYTRLDSLEALSKKHASDIESLQSRVLDCEDSIDAIAE